LTDTAAVRQITSADIRVALKRHFPHPEYGEFALAISHEADKRAG
jgi:hypothetical protein